MSVRTLFASLVLCIPIAAHADCTARMGEWVRTLHSGRAIDAERSACKIWPGNPAQSLAVLLLPQSPPSDDATIYDVDILVANSESGAIIAHLYQTSAITSDAVALEGVKIDTARWQLTPQVLAFGVSKTFNGSSSVNPYGVSALSLYVVDGQTLRAVLADLTTHESHGEWDQNCAGEFSDLTRAVSIGGAGQGGYATLHVHEKEVDSTQVPTKSDCVTRKKPVRQSDVTLGYDGTHYVVPAKLKFDQ